MHSTPEINKFDSDVAIIGCGIAGALTALTLPTDLKVLLFEAGEGVIPQKSSTANECYKVHTGMHYAADLHTALQCLHRSIELVRAYPQFVLRTENETENAPWKKFRHYFMSNSMITPEEARVVARALQNEYINLISISPENAVFGPAETFIREIPINECEYIADTIPFIDQHNNTTMESVVLAFETSELQIDIAQCREHLTQRIKNAANITFMPNTRILALEHNPHCFGYKLVAENEINNTYFSTASIVNCTWEQIEKLNHTAGFECIDERTNRLKASIIVELPLNLRAMPTTTFSIGPYCTITVFANGTAVLTSERTTNVAHFASIAHPSSENMTTYLNNLKLHTPKGDQLARQILQECASYLKSPYKEELIAANVIDLRLGFVKMMQQTQPYKYEHIFDAFSDIHARVFDGVERLNLGYINNASMKMVYSYGNALKVSKILQLELLHINLLNNFHVKIKAQLMHLLQTNQSYHNELDIILKMTDRKELQKILELGLGLTDHNYSIAKLHKIIKDNRLLSELVEKMVKMLDDRYIRLPSIISLLSSHHVHFLNTDGLHSLNKQTTLRYTKSSEALHNGYGFRFFVDTLLVSTLERETKRSLSAPISMIL